MHRFRTIAIVMAFLLVFSLITIIPTNADGQLFKVSLRDEVNDFNALRTTGVTFVEEYENFVICNISPNLLPTIEDKGYEISPFSPFTHVAINEYSLTPDAQKILVVAPELPMELTTPNIIPMGKAHFILQFDFPIKKEWTDEMEAAGAKVLGYLPEGGVIIKASANVVSKFHSWERIVGGTPIHPGLKIASDIVKVDDNPIKITVNLYSDEKIASVRDMLPGTCFDGTDQKESGNINIECDFEDINRIAWIEEVQSITAYLEPELFMDRSREIMGIEARTDDSSPSLEPRSEGMWDHGIRGQDRVVCVQDTGCDTGNLSTLNTDFGIPPRIVGHFGYNSFPSGPDPTQSKDWSDYNGHGTFTSAQVMGDGRNSTLNQYSGVAPEAGLVVQRGLGWLNPGLPDSYALGARVHSNSWGTPYGPYTAQCQYTDQFVWDNPDMVVCISAGNSGPNSSTLGTPSIAKNDMSVAAAGNNTPSTSLTTAANPGDTMLWVASNFNFNGQAGRSNRILVAGDNPGEDEFVTYTGRAGTDRVFIDTPLMYVHSVGARVHQVHAEVVARFSSRGPTSDTRIKPDIAGPGANVMGLQRFGAGYGLASGTSMSCPNVAGCSVLAQQWLEDVYRHGEPSAALIKALLINGARDIREDYDGTPLFTPSYIGGWGYVDLYDTIFPTAPTMRDYTDYKPGVVTGDRVEFPIMAGPGTFKVNLVWSDYPSIPGASIHLVNDLDLMVESPSGNIYRGNQYIGGIGASSESELNATGTDTTNNVEGVTLNNATESGMYIVSVDATNIPQGPQPFAISIEYEAVLADFDVRVTPDLVDITSNWRSQTFPVDVTPISGFRGNVVLTCSLLPAEMDSSFNPSNVHLTIDPETSILTLSSEDQLPVGTYYVIVRGTAGDIYHEDIITLRVRPDRTYKFDFVKDVGKGGIGNPHGDNNVMVYPSEKLGYSMQYNTADMDLFAELTIEEAIPRGAYFNGSAFPMPTHYSPDHGATWINERIPNKAGYGYRMRWDLHDIPGSGHLMKLTTEIPGYDNVSDDIESSTQQVMELDSKGYPHVVWTNHILGSYPSDDEIFYTRWNGYEWVDLQGNEGISNISNTTGTASISPDMFIDDSNNPHFIWVDENELAVYHCSWDGSALVKLDGTPGVDVLTTGLDPSYRYYTPRIEQGENGHIVSTFSYYRQGGYFWNGMFWQYIQPAYGLYFTKVSGGIWTELDGVTPGAQQALNSTRYTFDPSLAVDSNGDPYATAEYRRWFLWFLVDDHLMAAKWDNNIGDWTHFDGITSGWEIVMGGPVAHSNAELKMQTGDIPHLTWMDEYNPYGVGDIIYTRFDGGQWVMADGTPGYENVTNSELVEDNPHICFRPDGRPALIWEEQGEESTNIMFSLYNEGWRDLFNNAGAEPITDKDSESILPNVQIDASGTPFFSFVDNRTGDDDVYVTYPILEYDNANFPGEVIWEAKIDDVIPTSTKAIINNAYISGLYVDGATSFETVQTISTTTNPFETEIKVTKTASQSNVRIGDPVDFTINVTNNGSTPLTNINVIDYMPRGMEYINSRPEAKIRTNGVYWIIDSLAPGKTNTFKVTARITDERLNGKAVQNKVTVSADQNVKAEDYASVIVVVNTTGFPAPEVTFKASGEASSNSETEFTLHIWSGNGPFSFKINWGDGDSTSGNAELKTPKTLIHSFSSPGEYKIECEVLDRFGVSKLVEYKIQVN